jgi:hypothetical protein
MTRPEVVETFFVGEYRVVVIDEAVPADSRWDLVQRRLAAARHYDWLEAAHARLVSNRLRVPKIHHAPALPVAVDSVSSHFVPDRMICSGVIAMLVSLWSA